MVQDASPLEVPLTLVWTSAFQFFAVPLHSGASIIAGKGIFRREEVPAKEDGTARVAFQISGKRLGKLHMGCVQVEAPSASPKLVHFAGRGVTFTCWLISLGSMT